MNNQKVKTHKTKSGNLSVKLEYRIVVGVTVHRHWLDAHSLAWTNDAAGDLASIGDQNFVEFLETERAVAAIRNVFTQRALNIAVY